MTNRKASLLLSAALAFTVPTASQAAGGFGSAMQHDSARIVKLPTAAEGLENIPLSSLDLTKTATGWSGHPTQADKSIEGNAIRLSGCTYESGIGAHAPGRIIVKLNGAVTRFCTRVGIDDEVSASAGATRGIADYRVYVKGEDGSTLTLGEGTVRGNATDIPEIDVDVNGWKYLILETSNGADGTNDCDHVDWANAYLVYREQNSTRPVIVSEEEISSKLACATTVFSQPGLRFMHKIKSTDDAAAVSVSNLPKGLTWNAARHLVEGTLKKEGRYTYNINITSDGVTTSEPVDLTVSAALQHPVPFMGWISWNSVQSEVSEDIVKQVTNLLIDKGLTDCGWNTVMMDDWWHADARAADGSPQPNATRFPGGVKPLADYVHARGMRFGLYTDAAEYTCAGAFGSYGYETIDANRYAEWGVDVVKCDYCNAPSDAETAKTRYKALADAFKASGRNIMLYICEWGVREPWKWGAEAGGTCWRISYDVRDCWKGRTGGVGVLQSIDAMKNLSAYQGVNRFNDSDMLCTALHGTGKSSSDLCATGPGMTQDEYRTQFALWCMWSSPMALSFDPRSTAITDDDYAILRSAELIALNQDRMGQQADLIDESNDIVAFAKDCENGDVALSVTNLGSSTASYTFDFSTIPHLDAGAVYLCRDLWESADLAPARGSLTTSVRSHATKVFRLSKTAAGGISAVREPLTLSIEPQKNGIRVSTSDTAGLNKRILVSDTAGHIVAQAATKKSSTTFRLHAPGTYAVSVACGAQSKTGTVFF